MELTLTKLPWYAQVGAFVALAIGGCGVFYYYYEMPVRADMVARETQLQSLKQDVTKGLNTAKKLPEFRAQVSDLEGRLANLKAAQRKLRVGLLRLAFRRKERRKKR